MLTTDLAAGRLEDTMRQAAHDTESILRLLKATVRRLDDAEPGYPTGGHGGGGGDDSGPLRQTVVANDPVLRTREQLARDIDLASNTLRRILSTCHEYGITRHGSSEGVDERSTVCEWCSEPKQVKSRRLCDWCSSVLGDINRTRAAIGLKPVNRIPAAAIEHRRNGRARTTSKADIDRWSRNGGK